MNTNDFSVIEKSTPWKGSYTLMFYLLPFITCIGDNYERESLEHYNINQVLDV